MPLFFEIDTRLRFTVEVILGTDTLAKSLSEIIAGVTNVSKNIKQLYAGFISKEGRIHGQGRVQLVEGLDELFGVLLLLRENLKDRTAGENGINNPLQSRVSVDTRINKFVVKGVLNQDDISGIVSFNKGYDAYILKKIQNLLLLYKNTVNSEKLTVAGYRDIYDAFDEIFYNTLLLRYGVVNLLIDK
jgi:hypothetical protein